MKKKLSLFILSFMVAIAFMPAASFAESAPEMTAYDQVLKEGRTVYVGGAAGIYKVKLKSNGKVRSKKLIFKSYRPFGAYSYINTMYKQGGHIYFLLGTEGSSQYLKRVSTSGKSKSLATLSDSYYGYSIDGDTIYYSTYNTALDDVDWDDDWDYDDWDYDDWDDDDWDDDYDPAESQLLKRMNLDGSSKRDTEITPNCKTKKTSDNGYTRKIKKKGKYVKDYLKTPKGTFYLGKVKMY